MALNEKCVSQVGLSLLCKSVPRCVCSHRRDGREPVWFGVTGWGRPESQHTCRHTLFSQDAPQLPRGLPADAPRARRQQLLMLWWFGPHWEWGLSPPEWTPWTCSRCDSALRFAPGPPKGDVARHWSLNPESALLIPRNKSFLFFLTNKNYK